MKPRGLAHVLFALLIGSIVAAVPAGTEDVGELATSRDGGAWRVDAWLPGRVQSALARRDERGPAIWLFVPGTPGSGDAAEIGPCDRPTIVERGELWRFVPTWPTGPGGAGGAEGPSLERVLDGLPSLRGSLHAMDIDNDGTDELLALFEGGLYRLPTTPGAEPVPLSRDSAIDPRTSFLASFPAEGLHLLSVADLRSASYWRLTDGHSEPLRSVELPVQVRYRRNEFRLDTRPTVPLGSYGGVAAYADRPEVIGSQRLRGRLVRPTLDAETVVEWWARLPEPEEPIELRYLHLGGEPALFVTSRPANKLSLFGEKRLRLFRLATDRSQTGHRPFFAVETRANLWQSIAPYARDIDGDGLEDLVLAYWKGLTDSRIVLDVYLADGTGSYRRNPGTTGFDVKRGERSFVSFERDVTGDGVTDLLVIGAGRLQVHAGDADARKGRDLVDRRPAHQVAVVKAAKGAKVGDDEVEVDLEFDDGGVQFEGETLSSRGARLVDFDGDGVFEMLFSVPEDGKWKVSFVRVTAPRRDP